MEDKSEAWGKWLGATVTTQTMSGEGAVWSLWQNDLFIVTATPFECIWGACIHLVARAKTPDTLLGWAEKQRIKDMVAGAFRVAIEVFPPASEVVDQAPAYHLWVLPVGFKLPFGVVERQGVE